MDVDQKGLLYLFEHPFDPLRFPRAGGKIIFQQEGDEVNEALATIMKVPSNLDVMQDLHKCRQIPRGIPYSHFNPQHRAAAKELSQCFMDPRIQNMKMCWETAASVKDNVNEGIFIFALSTAIINNPSFNSRLVPAIYEVFPNKFIPLDKVQECFDQLKSAQYSHSGSLQERVTHDKDFTGTDLNPEHRVAYFREDYGLNSHHWHWHLVFNDNTTTGDRKGEIFFYMHNQMMTRMDWERLSNSVNRLVGFHNWSEPIPDGYFPKLTINNSSINYGNRPDNMTPQTVKTEQLLGIIPETTFDISEMEQWRKNLYEAIDKGYMIDKRGDLVRLNDGVPPPGKKRGIDLLGDAFEADRGLSQNYELYGDIHNWGHIVMAFIHDPLGYHKAQESPGVIGDSTTACRDPVFWRWHKFVDDVFQKYKMRQIPYEDKELLFESVEVESISVKSGTLDENVLETGWTYRSIEASRGLDFLRDQSVLVDLQHLTHRPFTYNIQVTNNQTEPVDVTVRLFMAPKFNETGKAMTFMDQRLLWGEMDKYQTTLQPGSNSLERLSTESNICIPEELTFRDLERNPPEMNSPSAYCGCGWPQHLLLPKGKTDGMDFQILVLVSDWEQDKVKRSAGNGTCSNAASFCGIRNEKFPDARPMGYPFDRKPNEQINNMDITNATDFAKALPNAYMCDIEIYFRDTDLNPKLS